MTWQERRDAELAAFAKTIQWPDPYNGPDDPLRRPAETPSDDASRRERMHSVAAAVANLLTDRPDADVRQAIADLLAYREPDR